jgi:hypothetical protein
MKTTMELADAYAEAYRMHIKPDAARAAMAQRIEALTKDAERYRAIREGLEVDPHHIGAAGIVVSLVDAFGGETLRGDAADEAIDAAIAEGKV